MNTNQIVVSNRRSYLRYIVVGVVLLVIGLALGKGRGNDIGDKDWINTMSAILLTVGFLTIAAAAVLELVSRLRHRT